LTPVEEQTAMRELMSTCELAPLPVDSIQVFFVNLKSSQLNP
jgi:hypothetical protein